MPTREQMLKRQHVLAEFGDFALRSEDLDEVLTEACRLVGAALAVQRAKVLEIEPDQKSFFIRAGIGWTSEIIGKVRLPMNERSSESYSIASGEPVITQDISQEDRFVFPAFMREQGIVAIANVPIFLPNGRAYGLLQVDSQEPREFTIQDTEFLHTYATILGPVIDRLFKIDDLQAALAANQRLLHELQHRIKNHIGIITSLVRLRFREVKTDEARQELALVGERIETLRLVHEQLYAADTAERLPLAPYVKQLIGNLCRLHEDQSGKVRLELDVADIDLSPDTAVPLGLIVNEFTTNSLKYAFSGCGGVIALNVELLETGALRVRISDNGKGLSAEPRPAEAGSGTGMKLIDALARQIGAEPEWSSAAGLALSLEFMPR